MSGSTHKDKLSVVIGTYHCTVAQFDFDLENGTVDRKWVDDTATRSISSIIFNGFFCIFGGNDELVRIVNVASNKNVGSLHEHQGSITHLETFQNTHLLSSSDDGKIYIWEIGGGNKYKIKNKKNMAKSWECLCCMHNFYDLKKNKKNKNKKTRNGDKMELELSSNNNKNSKILSFSIHPSGRLMLSIDNKHEMKIWDLIRAKCIVTILMPKPAISICWSPDGKTYAVIRENKVLIYHTDGTLYKVIKPITKLIDNQFFDRYQGTIVSFTYITHDMIAIADMNARIVVYDIDTKTPLFRLSGHDQIENDDDQDTDDKTQNSKPKVRSLKVCSLNDNLYLISADNRGRICVWNVHDCLNRVININSAGFDDLDIENQDIDIGDDIENDDPLTNLNKQQNGNDDSDQEKDDDSDSDDDDDEDDEDEDDVMVDENGLYTFPALMQVDTQTHITCMDVGIVGRLNMMYKWKKPKIEYGTKNYDDKDAKDDKDGNNTISTNKKDNNVNGSGKKRKFDEIVDEVNDRLKNNAKDSVDSDDDHKKLNQEQPKRKKRKKKKKKKQIDLSRFD